MSSPDEEERKKWERQGARPKVRQPPATGATAPPTSTATGLQTRMRSSSAPPAPGSHQEPAREVPDDAEVTPEVLADEADEMADYLHKMLRQIQQERETLDPALPARWYQPKPGQTGPSKGVQAEGRYLADKSSSITRQLQKMHLPSGPGQQRTMSDWRRRHRFDPPNVFGGPHLQPQPGYVEPSQQPQSGLRRRAMSMSELRQLPLRSFREQAHPRYGRLAPGWVNPEFQRPVEERKVHGSPYMQRQQDLALAQRYCSSTQQLAQKYKNMTPEQRKQYRGQIMKHQATPEPTSYAVPDQLETVEEEKGEGEGAEASGLSEEDKKKIFFHLVRKWLGKKK